MSPAIESFTRSSALRIVGFEKVKYGSEKDPLMLKNALTLSVSTEAIATITLTVVGNLVDNTTPGAADKVM